MLRMLTPFKKINIIKKQKTQPGDKKQKPPVDNKKRSPPKTQEPVDFEFYD